MQRVTDVQIEDASNGNMGVQAALLNARNTLGEANLANFLSSVPERGEALWVRFRGVQKASPLEDFNFNHFIASVLMSRPIL